MFGITGLHCRCLFNFIRYCQTVFQSCYISFCILTLIYKSCSCSAWLSALDIISIFNFSHSNMYVVAFYCSLFLHLLMILSIFHIFNNQLYIFCEAHFYWVFIYWVLRVLDSGHISFIRYVIYNIFSQFWIVFSFF